MNKKVIILIIISIVITIPIFLILDNIVSKQTSTCDEIVRRFGTAEEPKLIEKNDLYFVVKFERDYIGTFFYKDFLAMGDLSISFKNCTCEKGILRTDYLSDKIIELESSEGIYWKKLEDGSIYALCVTWDESTYPNPIFDKNATVKVLTRAVGYYEFPINLEKSLLEIKCPERILIYDYEGMLNVEDVHIDFVTENSAQISFYITLDATEVFVVVGKRIENELYWFKSIKAEQTGRAFEALIEDLNSGTVYYAKIVINFKEYNIIEFRTEGDYEKEIDEDNDDYTSPFESFVGFIIVIAFIAALIWMSRKISGKSMKSIFKSIGKKKGRKKQ